MGVISKLWDENPASIYEMKLKQLIVLMGDGNLNHQRSSDELRKFFTKIDMPTILRFIEESISEDKDNKFTERGFVLQDLVNEIGRRLGYNVTNGLYRGKRNDENGYDGLWEAPDGSYIIMESKTSDAYSLDIETLGRYKDELVDSKLIQRRNSSILIVLGRSDKGNFPNLIRGSNYSQDVRIISVRALFELLNTYKNTQTTTVQSQIMKLLKPHDFLQLDNLVELVFPQTDENILNSTDELELEQEVKEFSIDNIADLIIPTLPNIDLKVGTFIKQAMQQLGKSGYTFSETQLKDLCDKEWSKKTFNTNWPFMKIHQPNEINNLYDTNGRARYWTGTFSFGDVQVYITKELFEKDRNKEYFIEWYKQLKADQ